jgi:hypothetical protein
MCELENSITSTMPALRLLLGPCACKCASRAAAVAGMKEGPSVMHMVVAVHLWLVGAIAQAPGFATAVIMLLCSRSSAYHPTSSTAGQ